MQYGMVIDTRSCMGCNTCVVKCKQANNLPNGVLWNRIDIQGGEGPDTAAGTFPNCSMDFFPTACQHCKTPACATVCPTGATQKDPETGIVTIDWEVCIGCEACMNACPYGVRTHVQEVAYYIDVRLGEYDVPDHKENVVEKCTFCQERVSRGLEPACVHVCPGRARIFGDLDDPESEVSKLIAENETLQLQPEAGTNPSVYYII